MVPTLHKANYPLLCQVVEVTAVTAVAVAAVAVLDILTEGFRNLVSLHMGLLEGVAVLEVTELLEPPE